MTRDVRPPSKLSAAPVRAVKPAPPKQEPVAEPAPAVIIVAVVGKFPINCWPVKRVVYPGEQVPLPDHPWIRKQVEFGTLTLIE